MSFLLTNSTTTFDRGELVKILEETVKCGENTKLNVGDMLIVRDPSPIYAFPNNKI